MQHKSFLARAWAIKNPVATRVDLASGPCPCALLEPHAPNLFQSKHRAARDRHNLARSGPNLAMSKAYLVKLAPIAPKLVGIFPNFGMSDQSRQIKPNYGRIWLGVSRFWAGLSKCRPKSQHAIGPEFGLFRSKLLGVVRRRSDFCRVRANVDPFRIDLGRNRPALSTQLCSSSCHAWPDSRRTWPEPDRLISIPVRARPMCCARI